MTGYFARISPATPGECPKERSEADAAHSAITGNGVGSGVVPAPFGQQGKMLRELRRDKPNRPPEPDQDKMTR